MNKAYISLGSNIEPRKRYLDEAIEKLQAHSEVSILKHSSIYETPPVGYLDQDKFLNMAIEVETSLKNTALLEVCQQIERDLNRERTIKNGPRTIDLDILLFNQEYRELEHLQIPHPRMKERAFVLVPLCEIAPEEVMPTSGETIEEMLRDCSTKDIEAIIRWIEA